MNSTIKTEVLENFNFFFENFVITVISFGKVAENFSSSENCLSSYGVDFILEPLQSANYALQCGSYDEMVDFRHFFPNFIRHISTPMTSWWKFFCMCVASSYYASHKKFWPNASGYLQGCWLKTAKKGQKTESSRHNSPTIFARMI